MSAVISSCGTYRYQLRRNIPQPVRWIKPGCFVMLNPSTADATEDDPTIRRCVGFAKAFGWTELIVMNLFALRATDPKELRKHSDPVGPDNDASLASLPQSVPVIAAWGSNVMASGSRIQRVIDVLRRPIYCLGMTKSGAPKHPLYLPKNLKPYTWHDRTEYLCRPEVDARPKFHELFTEVTT